MLIRGRVCECVTLVHYNDCLCYFRWDYIVNTIVSTYIEDLLSNHRNKTSLRDWVRWQEHSRWGSHSVYKIWTRCLISSHWRCWRPTPPTILSLSPSRTSWISVRQPLKRNLSISWGKSFLSDCQTSWRRLTCFQPTSWKCLPLWHCRYRLSNTIPLPGYINYTVVQEWYSQSFKELVEYIADEDKKGSPVDDETLAKFCQTLKTIQHRHNNVVQTMAQGVLELKDTHKVDNQTDMNIQYFLDRFYMSRISLRMLLHQVHSASLFCFLDFEGFISAHSSVWAWRWQTHQQDWDDRSWLQGEVCHSGGFPERRHALRGLLWPRSRHRNKRLITKTLDCDVQQEWLKWKRNLFYNIQGKLW